MQSSGTFEVTVMGNGSITLGDIDACVSELSPFIRDPANWVDDTDLAYHFTNFLRNNHPQFTNLSGCAAQFISSTDHKLTLYGSGWVCPTDTGAVFGAAGPQVSTSLSTLIFTLAASYLVQMTLTSRRQR